MHFIENEKSETKLIDSFWMSNNNVAAQAAFVYPVPEGSYSVNISCEGLQAVDHIGGDEDGYWIGIVAYTNNSSDNWGIGNYKGCSFENYLATNTWRPGHKDLTLNDCQFKEGQIVERDSIISFKVKATGSDACFYLMSPKTMKTDKYNYVVSYGGYTNKRMEFGTISVTFDESDVEATRLSRHSRAPTRVHHVRISEEYCQPLGVIVDNGLYDANPPATKQNDKQDTSEEAVQKEVIHEEVKQEEVDTNNTAEETVSSSSEPDIAVQEYEAATSTIPDAEEDVLPSKEELSKKPVDSKGTTLPKPKEPEVLGVYQGQAIYPEDVPLGTREKLREAARAPSTLLYNQAPKQSKSFLGRLVEGNKGTKTSAPSTVSGSNMTREQLNEYNRIRKSLGVTAAKQYKANLS